MVGGGGKVGVVVGDGVKVGRGVGEGVKVGSPARVVITGGIGLGVWVSVGVVGVRAMATRRPPSINAIAMLPMMMTIERMATRTACKTWRLFFMSVFLRAQRWEELLTRRAS